MWTSGITPRLSHGCNTETGWTNYGATSEQRGTGKWDLNLVTLPEMLPFLAAGGHYLYTKPVYLYFKDKLQVLTTNSYEFVSFQTGRHVL
ncbi:hypothetical protein ElyMa_000163900 [Elysia marginata]|uniref:Uncharacterized protein n=1 Tax=Elysia marginata TaxID=1093978 RepID=A0AAV4ESU0_9GAST|nr:hypothetical protein ElyMa_000163900 [Elysia marginata]